MGQTDRADEDVCTKYSGRLTDITHDTIGVTKDMSVMVAELRDHIADFDDFFRPIRNYLYWEPHCFDIPVCWAVRSIFDALDSVDSLTDKMQELMKDLDKMDVAAAAVT